MAERALLDPKYEVTLQGKRFILYQGLLDMAHQEGLEYIHTTLVQIPSAENGQVAIVHAEVKTAHGVFQGLGDASPQSTSKMIAPHLLRLSETRAKARALRDAVNVGETALEELGEDGVASDPTVADPPLDDKHRQEVMRAIQALATKYSVYPDDPNVFPAYVRTNGQAEVFFRITSRIASVLKQRQETTTTPGSTPDVSDASSAQSEPPTEDQVRRLRIAQETLTKANLLGKVAGVSFDPAQYTTTSIETVLTRCQAVYTEHVNSVMESQSKKR